MPVVVVRGARQTSETTLVRSTPKLVGHWYVTLDDLDVRLQAEADPETEALVTSLPPAELNAAQWLPANRAARGIESGLHQRLDVSDRDDPCRVRRPKALRRMGLFRRSSLSLVREWRRRQKKPRHQTTTDFSEPRTPSTIVMPSAAAMPATPASKPLRGLAVGGGHGRLTVC
jgi:predicted transposase YbfD/YdcC